MQNEMMQVMALKILREIAENIRNSTFFSIMADETRDKSNPEQVVIVIRHVDEKLVTYEEFIGLSVVDYIDAATLTGVIKDCQLRMNVSLNKCRGQYYDGASNMSVLIRVLLNKFQMRKEGLFIHIVMDTPWT